MSDDKPAVPARATQPNPELAELTQRLSGKWRVSGPGIRGMAEYRPVRQGHLLVMNVDFVVNGTEMKVIQHIAYAEDSGLLQARYMDTMGDESTYTWVLAGQNLRVSQGEEKSETFFNASFNDDNSEYVGTWHYPDEGGADADEERIVYTRIA